MKFVEILIVLQTLAVICQTYQGFLPGIGSYLQSKPINLQVPSYASGSLPTYKRAVRQILDKPKDDPGSKCSYVQMKGSAIPGAECQEGGMACDKECALVDVIENPGSNSGEIDSERGCITVMEEMCGDVAKEECGFVDEKICEAIPEEICDDDVPYNQSGNQTK